MNGINIFHNLIILNMRGYVQNVITEYLLSYNKHKSLEEKYVAETN